MRDHQYVNVYARYLEGKGVEWDGDDNVEHMLEQVKQAVRGKNPKSVWWNDEIKAAVRRKEASNP